MRLISQDGMIDVPYENVCVSINYRNKNQITSWNFGCEDYEIVTMATYSNTAKALKVMEMLREEYDYVRTFETICNGGSNYPNLPSYIFQFPQDEEIEV